MEIVDEEYNYDRMATMELGAQENPKYHGYINSLNRHPCMKYKTWMFSLLIGSCLLATSGFSLYLGNLYPSEMDYLRCAAGSCIPSAIVHFSVLRNKNCVISHYQILYVSTFSITTTCLIWFGCKLAINPTAININFNLMLLILMEILMATTVIISARSSVDCCSVKRGANCGGLNSLRPIQFPVRMIKSFSIVEVVVGMSAVFGGVVALHIDALFHSPFLYVSVFWILAACFPCAVASHVAAEYPTRCLVEVLIATSSIASPLLFTMSAYLSINIVQTIDLFKTNPPDIRHFHEVLLLLLMLILLVQAALTNVTIIQCIHYKSEIIAQDSSWDILYLDKSDDKKNDGNPVQPKNTLRDYFQKTAPMSTSLASTNTLINFDKEKAWNAVMVQMTQ